MDRLYAQEYRDLYARHWWWRSREDRIVSLLEEHVGARAPVSILDVGCGDGLFFEKLERFGAVEGIEMDPSGLDPNGRWAARIRVGPFDGSFQPGRRYGVILMLDVLEHLADPAAALSRAMDLLEPDGTLLITVPAFRALWTSHDVLNRHRTRYTRGQVRRLVEGAGGRVIESRYFFLFTAPIKLAVRMREMAIGGKPTVPVVPPEWANRALYRLSRTEQRVFSRVPAPFGTSLYAVVRRGPEPAR